MSEEYEQLSRYRAGELTPEAARALEAQAGFAERLRQLQALDAAVVALPVGMSEVKLDALLAKVRRPEPKKRESGLNYRIGLVVAALVLCFLGWTFFGAQPQQWAVVPNGDVKIDGAALAGVTMQGSGRWALAVGLESSAQVVGPGGVVLVPAGAQVSHAKGLSLDRGSVLVRADGLTLGVSGAAVTVNGLSVISMEPAEGVARVTELLATTTSGDLMKSQWMKLSSLAATAAALGGGLTLFVVDGHASVRQGEGAPVVLQPGEQWKTGDAKPSAYRAPTVAVAPSKEPASAALTGESTRPTNSQLAGLSQPELVAMVERLSDEKESLLKQREALKKKVDPEDRKTNFYRFSPEELTEFAKKGVVRIRGPQLMGSETKIDDKIRDDLNMTPEEVARATAIFQESTERVRVGLLSLYKEMGGDATQATTLVGSQTLFNEIRSKALENDNEDAIRQVANERAGLVPAGTGGSVVMRAYRLTVGEDERVINELEKLLGPRRTEELLNHPKMAKHDHGYGAGPVKKTP